MCVVPELLTSLQEPGFYGATASLPTKQISFVFEMILWIIEAGSFIYLIYRE